MKVNCATTLHFSFLFVVKVTNLETTKTVKAAGWPLEENN